MSDGIDEPIDGDEALDLDQALGDDEVDEALDTSYSPPERPRGLDAFGTTAAEQHRGETLDQRLAQEEPDPSARLGPLGADTLSDELADDDVLDDDVLDDDVLDDDVLDDDEVGTLRAGRLVDPDEGLGEDTEKDLVATDVGLDAGAASAEEAAMHVVDPASRVRDADPEP